MIEHNFLSSDTHTWHFLAPARFSCKFLLKKPSFALPVATFKFNALLFHIHLISFLYYPSSTLLIITMVCYSNFSGFSFPLFLYSDPLHPAQAWRCHSAEFLLDPPKWPLLNNFRLQNLFKSLCGVQEATRAVESRVVTSISCILELQAHHCLRTPGYRTPSQTWIYCVQPVLLYWRNVYYWDIGSDQKIYRP